jgi:hypothetical protein
MGGEEHLRWCYTPGNIQEYREHASSVQTPMHPGTWQVRRKIMKCQVVFDKHGSIVSVRHLDLPVPEVYDYLAPRFGPIAGEGQTVAELKVPDLFEGLTLTDLVARLNVDVQAKQPSLVARQL